MGNDFYYWMPVIKDVKRKKTMTKKKYSREYLENLVIITEEQMTASEKSSFSRSKSRGTAFYGRLPRIFPIHYRSFRKMHDHFIESAAGRTARDIKISSAFKRTANGLINFILETGPVPSNMKYPTLIRKYISRGFVRGNLMWKSASAVPSQTGDRKRIDTRQRTITVA